jgi:transcriptional regulator with XRE-family HTH domain
MTEPTAGPYSAEAGVKIRQARTDAGLSLTEAAAKSGRFSAPALRSWEAGQRGLTIDRAVEVARLFGIPPASLMPTEPAADIDEATVARVVVKLATGGALQKIARILAADGLPDGLPPGGDVDLLDLVVQSLRAQQRTRSTIPTVDEPDDVLDGTP